MFGPFSEQAPQMDVFYAQCPRQRAPPAEQALRMRARARATESRERGPRARPEARMRLAASPFSGSMRDGGYAWIELSCLVAEASAKR